jgi:hypothetical protein
MSSDSNFTEELYIKRKNEYQGPFCCFDMDSMINEGEEPLYNVKYNPTRREYYLKSLVGPYAMILQYCPWCGSKLPESLRKQWYAILRTEFHLNPNDPDDEVKIPQEFLSDEWWKKRAL